RRGAMNNFKTLPPNFTISEDGNYAILSVPIEKSDNDDRSYTLIRLSNELEALLVHDSETDKSSAALNVCIGNSCDPVSIEMPCDPIIMNIILYIFTLYIYLLIFRIICQDSHIFANICYSWERKSIPKKMNMKNM